MMANEMNIWANCKDQVQNEIKILVNRTTISTLNHLAKVRIGALIAQMLQLETSAIQNTTTTIFNLTHSYSYSVLTYIHGQIRIWRVITTN